VAFDLIVAVEIGIVVAAVLALLSLAKASGLTQEPLPDLADHVDTDTEHRLMHDHIVIYRIDGSMFFGAAQRFLDELTAISDVRVVILRMSGMTTLDATGANALKTVVKDLNARRIVVLFKGLQPTHEQLLINLGVINGADGDSASRRQSFATLDEAIADARKYALTTEDIVRHNVNGDHDS
jgi:SulP family sulfate permease